MSTQTVLGHSFPTPCKRCGGALYRQVDYCPYCGAVHPLDASPLNRAAISGNRASAMNQAAPRNSIEPATQGTTDLTPRAAPANEPVPPGVPIREQAFVSPDTPIPPLAELPQSRVPVRKVLFGIAVVVLIGLAYVAYALFGGDHDSLNGSGDQSSETTQDARTTTGTIAPYAPAPSTSNPIATRPSNPVVASKPVSPANTGDSAKSEQIIPVTPVVPLVAASTPKPAAPQFRDAAQALQTARVDFRANDLSAAQGALGAAQALQPGDPDAQNLASELRPLTARRDAALQAAQTCVAQQSWPCARQHADEALAIDAGNETAKNILERVIRETGWAPVNSHAAVAPAPGK